MQRTHKHTWVINQSKRAHFLTQTVFSQRQLIIEAYRQCACDVTIAATIYSCCSSCSTPLVKPQFLNATILYNSNEFLTLTTITNILFLSMPIFLFLSVKFTLFITFLSLLSSFSLLEGFNMSKNENVWFIRCQLFRECL